MSTDLFEPESDELELEPEPESELELEPEPDDLEAPVSGAAPSSAPAELPPSVPNGGDSGQLAMRVMDVLPANFPLPTLIRFVPDLRLKLAAEHAAAHLLSLEVAGKGPQALAVLDAAMDDGRKANQAITESFDEPASIAYDLHRSITGTRGEWCKPVLDALAVKRKEYAAEQLRLERLAAEEKRKAQEEADRQAREEARKAAEEAAKQNAPAAVVEEMKKEAETAKAPPVAQRPIFGLGSPPARNTVVKTWKCRLGGTPADDEPNPAMVDLTPAQRFAAFHLIVNVAAQLARELKLTLEPDYLAKLPGAPLAALDFDWSYLNARASKDKSTFSIPGVEAYQDSGTRAKPTRRK